MEWRPAEQSVCLPLLISPCTIKSRSSLLAPAHPGGPGKRAVKFCGYDLDHWTWPRQCQGESPCQISRSKFISFHYKVTIQTHVTDQLLYLDHKMVSNNTMTVIRVLRCSSESFQVDWSLILGPQIKWSLFRSSQILVSLTSRFSVRLPWKSTRKFPIIYFNILVKMSYSCLQCFDTVGWAAGRASGL